MSTPEPPLDPVRQLDLTLRDAAVQTVLLHQAVAERLGMNLTDFECLSLLNQHGPLPAGQLAELTGLTTGAITHVVDRLEKADWVRRASDPVDRRRVIVEPVAERLKDAFGLLDSLGGAVGELVAHAPADDLAVLIAFQKELQPIMQREVVALRRAGDPSAQLSSARLVVHAGTPRLALRGDPHLADLYQAHFGDPPPRVRVSDGTVSLTFGGGYRADVPGVLADADVVLNSRLPWSVEVRGGLTHLSADFGRVHALGLEVRGGIGGADIRLGTPRTVVPLRFSGGTNALRVLRPVGVPMRVRIRGGASHLALDDQHMTAVGGQTVWESSDQSESSPRYELEIAGGANGITVGTY